METPDTSLKYVLTNSYAGALKELASNGDMIFMDTVSTDENHIWYLTSTTSTPYFRLHTLANGDSQSLDVVNDNGTSSTNVHFASSGDYSGQFWRFDSWGDGTYKLSNKFTGPDMHLDTYSDTLEPFLGDGDHTGQHWTFNRADGIPTVIITSESMTSSAWTLPSTFTSPSATTAAITHSYNNTLPTGAIVGIAIGGLITLTLCICAVIFFLRSKRMSNRSKPEAHVSTLPSYSAAQEKGQSIFAHATSSGTQEQGAQGALYPAELVGGVVHCPVEMPAHRF